MLWVTGGREFFRFFATVISLLRTAVRVRFVGRRGERFERPAPLSVREFERPAPLSVRFVGMREFERPAPLSVRSRSFVFWGGLGTTSIISKGISGENDSGPAFLDRKGQFTNKQPRTTAGVKGTPPPPPGSTLIPGLWPPPDRSVFRVWVPVYFVSGGTFHAAYLLRGCGASTPHFLICHVVDIRGVAFLRSRLDRPVLPSTPVEAEWFVWGCVLRSTPVVCAANPHFLI